MQPLPLAFVENMRRQLGETEAQSLFESLDGQSPVSVRLNPRKWLGGDWGEAVPWCRWGRYLDSRPQFTTDIPFVAGGYYVQEAGSQFIEYILRNEPLSGCRVLDMCAAPGGKSTLYSSLVGDEGLVVANEYVRNRANILADNIRKWGLGNVVVTNNDPSHIAPFEQWFDVVAVDAPCSGEGMFRKDEVARTEWSDKAVDMCVARQISILEQAWKSLRAGGLFIYSTCTFNDREDEGVLRQMNQMWGEEICPSQELILPQEWGVEQLRVGDFQGFRFYPHRAKSEGFFVAVARKRDDVGGRATTPKPRKKIIVDAPKQVVAELSKWVECPEKLRFAQVGEQNYCYAASQYEAVKALSQSLTVIYSGVEMGQIFKGRLKPEWPLSQSVWYNEAVVPAVECSEEVTLDYLRKKDIPATDFVEGINLIKCNGYKVGFAKKIGNRINNTYPNSLKINNL